MFKSQEDQIAVLGICVDAPALTDSSAELNYHAVHNGRAASTCFAWSVRHGPGRMKLPDMATWIFCAISRPPSPPKWALVGGPISNSRK